MEQCPRPTSSRAQRSSTHRRLCYTQSGHVTLHSAAATGSGCLERGRKREQRPLRPRSTVHLRLGCEPRVNVTLREITANDPSLEADLYPLLAALRPGLSVDTFDTLLSEGREQGLRVLIADQGADRCIGAALYRIVATSRGRVTFLDDLVTNPARRSKGVGAALLAEVERRGRAAGCERLELDSGVNNQGAHRFYHRHGLHILALHFAKELESA